jgi:hypothetical protein
MKQYPLRLRNLGKDKYLLISGGHHDFDVFMAKVSEEYKHWHMDSRWNGPEHIYCKVTPGGYWIRVSNAVRGSFPATIVWE